ncbi:MAG TPA: sigma-70 family RNA polymerase sigma factor [Candidatus Hydrogenedens sp.]|nr:sigma-70 family RNA polymerase sigma factor [Candidatus Hydrogenedens sp.]
MQPTDDQCLDLWIYQRDKAAISELVSRHGGMVYGVAMRLTNDPEIATEIAKNCFKKLCESNNFPSVPIAVYLHREATRESVDAIHSLPMPAEPVSSVSWNDIKKRIDVLIANLSEKFSYPLILHILEGQEPANLVSYLKLPREKIEERITKGIEHIRHSLSLVKINLGSPQLAQILSSNAYEPCPAQLSDAIITLLQEIASQELPTTKVQRKKIKRLIPPLISFCLAIIAILFLLLLIIFINKANKAENIESSVINSPLVQQSIETSPPQEESREGKAVTTTPTQEQTKSISEPAATELKANVNIDLKKKLFQLLYSRYEEQRKTQQVVYYNSRNFTPMDAFYYYLLAVETLPPSDLLSFQPTWELLLSGPANPIPDEIINTFTNFQESFQLWRSGVSYERGVLPSPNILGEIPFPIEPFQNFFELFVLNILIGSRQPNDSLIMDINALFQFAESVQKQAYGKLAHLPLFAIESMDIALRELARLHLLAPQQFREGMNLLTRAEKVVQDKNTIQYNEYRQIAAWAQTEFPSIPALRQGLQNFLQEPEEKDWLSKISDNELQSIWDEFLSLPQENAETDTSNYPLEDLRKIIFPPDTPLEQHRKHTQTTIILSKLFLAIEWYALDNGSYPPSLEYLMPSYLPDLMQDKLSELSLQYEFDGSTYQIHTYEGISTLIPWHGDLNIEF